jgi:drug/metabolite transporter (DMT)-like permease
MSELRGYVMILGAAVFWGGSATAAKLLLSSGIDVVMMVQVRVTVSAVLMCAWLAVMRPGYLRVERRDLWRFAMLGILGVAGANVTYYTVIGEATVATAILLQYLAPVVVMAYTVATREEHLSTVKVIAAGLALAGCMLAVGAFDPGALTLTPLAAVAGAGSILTFAFLTVAPRRLLRSYSSWTTTLYAILFASAFWLVINPPWRVVERELSGTSWAALAALAVFSILLPHSLFFAGLRHVVPSRALIISTLEPVVAIGSAAVVAGERLRAAQLVGAVCVLSAIVLLNIRREGPAPARVQGERHAT